MRQTENYVCKEDSCSRLGETEEEKVEREKKEKEEKEREEKERQEEEARERTDNPNNGRKRSCRIMMVHISRQSNLARPSFGVDSDGT